jgi:hypothetical protein
MNRRQLFFSSARAALTTIFGASWIARAEKAQAADQPAPSSAANTTAPDTSSLPLSDPPFKGKISETFDGSFEDWPTPIAPPTGAPNVVVILLDDVGFGQTGTFGGPVSTPNIDKLASVG